MGGPGSNGGYFFDIGEIKIFAFFQTRKFSKMLKNQSIIYNFLKIVSKFCDFLKILSKFSRKFMENLENFRNIDLLGGSGADPPEASEYIKKICPKINGNQQHF